MSNIRLKKVIFKLNFLGGIKLSQKVLDSFKRTFLDDFPKIVPQDRISLEMAVDLSQKITKEKKVKVYSFLNETENNSITLEPEAITLEINNYSNYEEFRSYIQKAIAEFEKDDSSIKVSRIGLRYINQIIISEGNPFELSALIKEPLICAINFIGQREELSRLMGVIELNKSDYFVKFQYGWFNSEFPNPIAKKEFLLDYDCYSNYETDLSSILSNVETYHTAIKELFDYSTRVES